MKLYLKIFLKSFLKSKAHYLLNLLSLVMGITCFLFALLFVFYERGYDDNHTNHDRIARIVTKVVSNGNETKVAYSNGFLSDQMPKAFPEISKMVRFLKYDGRASIKYGEGNNNIAVQNIYYSEPPVFDVFSYRLKGGDAASCLKNPNSIVLTNKLAEKIFGRADAMNQTVVLNGKLLKVTGVMFEFPGNTDLTFEALISINTLPAERTNDWMFTYILFTTPSALSAFQAKLDKFAKDVVNPELGTGADAIISYSLQPLKTIHFGTDLQFDTPKGNRIYVNIFFLTGILVLLIAAVNSINMAIVRSFSRSMEVAVHKIFGASRQQLILRQVVESSFLSVVAAIISILLILFFLPSFSVAIDRTLTFSDLFKGNIFFSLLSAIVLVGVGGAIYTSLYLNKIQLADTVKSRNSNIRSLRIVPRVMLSFQFFISICMVVAAISVYRQVKFFKDSPLGFNPDNIIILELPQGESAASGFKYLNNTIKSDPNVMAASFCSATALPGSDPDVDVMEYIENGVKVKKTVKHFDVDAGFFPLLQIPFKEGNNFLDLHDSTARNNAIVNSLFAKEAGWKNPIGQTISFGDRNAKVVGVVPDIHFNSLHKTMMPIVVLQQPDAPAYMLIRVKLSKTSAFITDIESAWKKAFPDLPFYYSFLDQHIVQQYQDDNHLLSLLLVLTILILIISVVGLVAYVSFTIRAASLDIAVRRIVGARFGNLFNYFFKKFIFLLLTAFVVACPLTIYLVHNWLNQFSYHIYQRPVDFVIAFIVVVSLLILVILTFTIQCIRAIPARILREK